KGLRVRAPPGESVVIDDDPGRAAAAATPRFSTGPVAVGAVSECSVGDTEGVTAITSCDQHHGTAPVLDREALEGVAFVDVEGPEGGVAGHRLPILGRRSRWEGCARSQEN
ncbi:MAG: hypothetical protein M3346_04740, partial [Actinomycetota bacterium]|nr:hypothetical protein [Actinomycetota bacterium]